MVDKKRIIRYDFPQIERRHPLHRVMNAAEERQLQEKFLSEIADEVGLDPSSKKDIRKAVFLARFAPENQNKNNSFLAKKVCYSEVDPTQQFNDRLSEVITNVSQYFGLDKKARGRGRPPRDSSPWQQLYNWLWEMKYLDWRRSYLESKNNPLGLLWELEYIDQQRIFEDFISNQKSLAAFIVTAKDREVQRWLTKRLAAKVPGFITAKKIEVKAGKYKPDFDRLFLHELAEALKVPAEIENIKEAICKLCRESTLIIVIHCIENIYPQNMRSIVNDFWVPLVEQISSEQSFSFDKYLLFLMIGDIHEQLTDCCATLESQQSLVRCNLPIALEPLTYINDQHIIRWLRESKVRSTVEAKIGSDNFQHLNQELSNWKQDPWWVIRKICEDFFEIDEISIMESYWKLAT